MLKGLAKKNVTYVIKRPKLVLAVALVLTILAGILASGLSMELSWVALAPQGNESVKEYQEIIEEFPTLNTVMLVVESDDQIRMAEAVRDVEKELSGLDDYVRSVTSGVDQEFAIDYALLLSGEDAESLIPMLADANYDTLQMMLSYIILSYDETLEDMNEKEIDQFEYAMITLTELIDLSTNYSAEEKGELKKTITAFLTGNPLMTSEDGKMTMVLIQPSFDMMDIEKLEPGVNVIESVIQKVNEKYDDVALRATGMHIVARDEMASIQSDSSLTTIIALILILGTLYFAFRAFSAPVLAFIPLIIGIVWDVGLTKLVIGRLNMMTAFSAAMLMGLGIDYAIHMYSSYTERRSLGYDKYDALEHAITVTGPGIITGAMTTAVAFLALNMSQLELLSELGTVMGLGIICTLISVFWVLPALLVLKKEKEEKIKKIRGHYKWIGNISMASRKFKIPVIIILVLGTIFMGYQAKDIEFDLNLMNLEPEGLESIELMEYLVEEYDMSADSFSIQVDSLDEVYRLQEEYEKIDGVREVASIATLIPEDQDETIDKIKEMTQMISVRAPQRTSEGYILELAMEDHLKAVDQLIESYKQLGYDVQVLNELKSSMENFKSSLDETDLEALSEDYYDIFDGLIEQILDVKPLTPDALPDNFKAQFVSKDGNQYLMTIYMDFDIWSNMDTEKGEKFFDDLMAVSPSTTGTPLFMKVLYDSASEEMLQIGLVLLAILIVIMMIHFRTVKYTALALIPLLLTLIFMVGTMKLINLPFNMLNFLSVLLVIGIGIDDGVHILHHYKAGQRKIHYLFSSVGRAILLTTITTMCGFGSLIFSSYRGIASLGAALFIGVGYAFIMTVIVLPMLLREE